uniref:IRG-type G domain-containing protein n=1 Tax=Marmota marmota marmota TaxID=9994 RepID=A0A8C6A333_MARMA
MGQQFSGTPAHDQHHDLASSFTAHLKNLEVENEIISQETISLIELQLKKGNIEEATFAINSVLEKNNNAQLNIAVTGESGAGKSSFVNALRGIGHEEKDAALIGVVEMTMKRTPYIHPDFPNVIIWDLPGIGITKFQPKHYLENVKFREYDFFIIVSATRFKKNDLDLAKTIKIKKKDFYFVRTKVDCDLKNAQISKPTTFDREKVLQQIREDCVINFKSNNINKPQIFLISNCDLSKYDFPILKDKLLKDLLVQKHRDFMLSLLKIIDRAILRNRYFLKQFTWLEELKSKILATLPVESITNVLVWDDASLQIVAENLHVPLEQFQNLLKISKNTFEIFEDVLAFYKHFTTELHYDIFFFYLKTVSDDAEVLLKEIYSRNRWISN